MVLAARGHLEHGKPPNGATHNGTAQYTQHGIEAWYMELWRSYVRPSWAMGGACKRAFARWGEGVPAIPHLHHVANPCTDTNDRCYSRVTGAAHALLPIGAVLGLAVLEHEQCGLAAGQALVELSACHRRRLASGHGCSARGMYLATPPMRYVYCRPVVEVSRIV